MNKVIQANLGGLAFTFDDEAYDRLDAYLAQLDRYFRRSPGHGEIMHDIEARMAELFGDALKGRRIVTSEDIDAAIAVMGRPEQFAVGEERRSRRRDAIDADADTDEALPIAEYDRLNGDRGKRKLMRDTDEKVIGGVCSGLSAYFGIDNPVWFRLAFAAAFFGAGVGLIPYVILWIALPKARTAGDRLAMRGEPADAAAIGQQIEREVRDIGEQISRLGDEFSRTDWSAKWDDLRGGRGWSKRPKRRSRTRAEKRDARAERRAAYAEERTAREAPVAHPEHDGPGAQDSSYLV